MPDAGDFSGTDGLPPEQTGSRRARHPLLRGVAPEAVDVLICAQAGFLLRAACSADASAGPRLVRMMPGLASAPLRRLADRRAADALAARFLRHNHGLRLPGSSVVAVATV